MSKLWPGWAGPSSVLRCSVSKIFIIKCNFPQTQHNQLWRTKYKIIVKFSVVACRVTSTVR